MRTILVLAFATLIAACSSMSPDSAKQIAYERLSSASDQPTLQGPALLAALTVQKAPDGKYLVELRDEPRNLLWAVIVLPSGDSEITHMAIDG